MGFRGCRSSILCPTLLFLAVFIVAAMVNPVAAGKTISIQGGFTVFPDPRNAPAVYVEFPFAIHRNEITLLPDDETGEGLIGAVYADIILTDTLGNRLDSASTYFYTRAASRADAADINIRLFNRLSLMIKPGTYRAVLTVLDAVSKAEGSFLYDPLEIAAVVTDRLNLSQLELAYKIALVDDSAEANRFVKNGREIIPNPMGIVAAGDTSLFVYAELYNLRYDDNPRDTFQLNYCIFDDTGNLLFDYGQMIRRKPGSSVVISNALDIADFSAGRYDLRLVALDFAAEQADTVLRRFFIFPETEATLREKVITYEEIHPYDTASIETKKKLVKYQMAAKDLAMLETLNKIGQARFIDQFISDRDPDPETEANEFLDDLMVRFIYANENFSSLPELNDGWRSDRGRVLLQYGHWDDREEIFAPSYSHPWEKWDYYSVQGGVYFIFEDADGYGDYKLIHSTADGEVRSAVWEKYIKENMPALLK